MLRRYDKMLPSQWQQSIAAGGRQSFETYLHNVTTDPRHRFWQRHGFVDLTRRWAEVVGPENVTTVVVDESDHEWLLRVFERMVGLDQGTLRTPPDRSNRSLTRGEVELLRRFNHVREQAGWADRVHFNYIRLSASPAMRRMPPDPEGGRLQVPADLQPMLAQATQRDLAALTDLGVRVVGDPDLLRPPPADASVWSTGTPEPATVAVGSAAAAVTAVVERRAEHGPLRLRKGKADGPAAPPVEDADPAPGDEVARLSRRSGIHVVPPPGPEGHRMRGWIHAAGDAFTAARRPCRVVDGLDEVTGRRAHVVLMALPPRQELAGRWHEHVVAREQTPFAAWQQEVAHPAGGPRLVREAVDRFGAAKVSVLVVDAFAPARAERTLARLGAVDPRDLPIAAGSRAVLSWAETALLRRLDETARTEGWDEPTWQRYVERGVVPWLLSGPPARLHQGIALDEASAEWVRRESRALLDAFAESGVRVLGDLGPLRHGAKARATADPEPRIRPGTAAMALGGVIAGTEERPDRG
jgi:hypothetical protein